MSVETNEAIVRRLFEEVYSRRNAAAMDESIAPGFVNHSAAFPVRGKPTYCTDAYPCALMSYDLPAEVAGS